MNFSRARAAPLRAAFKPRRTAFGASFRRYSTEAPKSSSKTVIYAVGAVALAGGAYFAFGGDSAKSAIQSAKVKANFVPTKEDYQKVCIAMI